MCEHCPVVGRCSICDSFTAVDPRDLKGSPLPSYVPHLDELSDEGFVVENRGVAVRFSNHKDAMTVLTEIPTSRLRI